MVVGPHVAKGYSFPLVLLLSLNLSGPCFLTTASLKPGGGHSSTANVAELLVCLVQPFPLLVGLMHGGVEFGFENPA